MFITHDFLIKAQMNYRSRVLCLWTYWNLFKVPSLTECLKSSPLRFSYYCRFMLKLVLFKHFSKETQKSHLFLGHHIMGRQHPLLMRIHKMIPIALAILMLLVYYV